MILEVKFSARCAALLRCLVGEKTTKLREGKNRKKDGNKNDGCRSGLRTGAG